MISNADGKVGFPVGLTLGGGGIAEAGTAGNRALTLTHDVGAKFVCGQSTVLTLSTSSAIVQVGLQVTGSCVIGSGCAITGQLTVNGTNILDQLSEFQASTGGSTIASVSGLQAALDSKSALLTSSSTLQLSQLTCSRKVGAH